SPGRRRSRRGPDSRGGATPHTPPDCWGARGGGAPPPPPDFRGARGGGGPPPPPACPCPPPPPPPPPPVWPPAPSPPPWRPPTPRNCWGARGGTTPHTPRNCWGARGGTTPHTPRNWCSRPLPRAHRQIGGHGESSLRCGPGRQRAAERGGPLPHPDEPVPAAR